ncbi:nitrogenase iron-molybdenum cofactor biosynthesis protein NifN [Paenibacillus rhizophilus]|uniref:Nitrogenase iron-molybdenum cofactor biosynthesis protein NifN n=1 Tax=Paenibacillus rhizophilus TaxID=1850366 RepID=A0A3N9Q4E3_9BACL|nr:nitrogenase iron-molybdenum cofactor biosynthesis protein NifN [Paenibacillus rhizophilus]RQW12386.1 nitrogenase iron-molybdenum cofactor biosynthesis protein NifN [Paenibacillus rhizophilus]
MTVKRRSKPVSVNPLKIGQSLGGVLAMQGCYRAMPIVHGSQGCSAFPKALLTRHFREPIAVQTSALQEMDVIFDANRNLEEALNAVLSKHRPDIIGIIGTELTDVAGVDYQSMLKSYKRERNMRGGLAFSVTLPDFRGSLESGYSVTVEAMVDELIQQAGLRGQRNVNSRQITLLPGSYLTPGDVMELKEIVSSFGFEVIALPDISTSLSGHLLTGFSPLTRGGVPLDSMLQSLQSGLTIAFGASMERPARRLHNALGTPYKVFQGTMGLKASDELLNFLHQISGVPVPIRYCWQRENLLDCMLDAHFQFAGVSALAALEPDHLRSVSEWLDELGVEQKALITSYETPAVAEMEREVWVGDLDDAEVLGSGADLWISSSHGIAGAERIGAAFLAAGFPIWNELGSYMNVSVGYRGAMEWTNKAGNLLMRREAEHRESRVRHR